MPRQQAISYCPLKFNSKTIEADGVVGKLTCECEEEKCSWWLANAKCCGIARVAQGIDVFSSMQKLERLV